MNEFLREAAHPSIPSCLAITSALNLGVSLIRGDTLVLTVANVIAGLLLAIPILLLWRFIGRRLVP